ncbi:Beta-galactosidase C-terminal domain [Glycomyces sp. L485]|uniref:Beta-galactosidase C-terminal domain n=1 Tax=Glycomyces sp. L485 TaxID=2909235 RepID=UPI001F4A16A9|nr:Beta-galactosidase C-terminal domain [Glycomyces sp. L485]
MDELAFGGDYNPEQWPREVTPSTGAIFRREFGKGEVWYLSTRLTDLDRLDITGELPGLPVGVETVRRVHEDGRSYLFAINHTDKAATIPTEGTDLLTGATWTPRTRLRATAQPLSENADGRRRSAEISLDDRQIREVLRAIEMTLVRDDVRDGEISESVDDVGGANEFLGIAAGNDPGNADFDDPTVEPGDLVAGVIAGPQRGVSEKRSMLECEFACPPPGLAALAGEYVDVGQLLRDTAGPQTRAPREQEFARIEVVRNMLMYQLHEFEAVEGLNPYPSH